MKNLKPNECVSYTANTITQNTLQAVNATFIGQNKGVYPHDHSFCIFSGDTFIAWH